MFDGTEGEPKMFCDITLTHFHEIGQKDNLGLFRRKSLNHPKQYFPLVCPRCVNVKDSVPKALALWLDPLQFLPDRFVTSAPPANFAVIINGPALSQCANPATQLSPARVEVVRSIPKFEEHILHHFLHIVGVEQNSGCNAHHESSIAGVQTFQGIEVPCLHTLHECLIVTFIRRHFGGCSR